MAVLDLTRDRLVQAAADVFAEKGYDGAGVQEIARRAGLTTGAIYGRFAGKAELLKVAVEECCSDELDELFAQNQLTGNVADILLSAGSHLVQPGAPDKGAALLREAFSAAAREPEVAAIVESVLESRASRLADLIERAKVDGDIDPDIDTQSLVRFCHAVGLGFLLYDAVSLPMPAVQPWEQLITRLVGAVRKET